MINNGFWRNVWKKVKNGARLDFGEVATPLPSSQTPNFLGGWGEQRTLSERLIFQSPSKIFSFQPEEELQRKVWESLKDDDSASRSNVWEQYCNARLASYNILLTLMPRFCGVMALIRKTTKIYAARRKAYIRVGSSSLPNPSPHESILGVAASGGPQNFLFSLPFHFIACCILRRPSSVDGTTCKLLMTPCQRVT